MSTKRVILANGSRLVRETFRRVIDGTGSLEVVQETSNPIELSSIIQRFEPEWVFLFSSDSKHGDNQLDTCVIRFPSVRFVVLEPDYRSLKIRFGTFYEQDITKLSLHEFIDILERDPQHT